MWATSPLHGPSSGRRRSTCPASPYLPPRILHLLASSLSYSRTVLPPCICRILLSDDRAPRAHIKEMPQTAWGMREQYCEMRRTAQKQEGDADPYERARYLETVSASMAVANRTTRRID